jgi:hypothetical protein
MNIAFTLTTEMISRARELWNNGQTLDAGKVIYECLPVEARPLWAARVLRLVVKRTGIISQPIEHAIGIANTPRDWGKANGAFLTLRVATLELENLQERSPKQELLLNNMLLAELVAKVTYNATSPSDEYDEDSGWWIAQCLKDILDLINDEKFSIVAWTTLCLDEKPE